MFVFRWVCLLASVEMLAQNTDALGADSHHPRVAGFERFYAAPPPQPEDEDEPPIVLNPVTGGRILLGELNCTSCHLASDVVQARLSSKQAPILDEVGSRAKVEWLRAYLANPHQLKPGTTMPDLIATLPESQRSASVEALTHFLASTGTVADGHRDPATKVNGAALFQKVGCLACHNALDENSPILDSSILLPDLTKKYTAASLTAFLRDPLRSRPSGRMPNLGLTDEESASLGQHLARDGQTRPNVNFTLFHGNWSNVPNFSDLKPVREGESEGFDLSIVADRSSNYGVQFRTNLQIIKPGEFEFWLGSDDGSQLFIDGKMVVDCDGVHPHQTKEGRISLAAGFHPVVVSYFQGEGGASLEVEFAGQGLPPQPLSGFAFLEPKIPASESSLETPLFVLDPGMVAKGRKLFATVGCASCHQMKIDGQLIASEFQSKPMSQIAGNKGCLSEKVTGKAPRYGLSKAQRESITAAMKSESEEAPAETIHRTLATLNCYACHQRNKLGGVEPSRDGVFASLQKEMGDEGRLPPNLTAVGDKLQPDWLRQVLHHGAEDRKEYMVTKMPKFGASNVEPLVELFGSVDMRPETMPEADFTEPEYRIKADGRHLVGGQALSCIKCHDFGPYPSTGVRAISLTSMTKRLRPDWFYRYVLDPQTYRRGTRMPAPWPFGQATIRETLHADVNLQVQAVWLYLSDREKASVPYGLVREPIELKPNTEPIIYRNFIEGAGSRAIGVGYSEGVNLAFDANQMRMAMIWHGAFIDAARHWTGRGAGFEAPLGDDILSFPNQVSFLILDKPDQEVPTGNARDLGYKFLGYHLDSKQRPIFRYSIHGLTIEDHPIPEQGEGKYATLKRSLQFQGSSDTNQLWYRAATAQKLEELGEGRYRVDGSWTIQVTSTASEKPIVRESAGKRELLVPVRLKNSKAEINQHYIW